MPDQPDDPIHYEMKIPPEPKDAPLNKQEQQKASDEEAHDSKTDESGTEADRKGGNPTQSHSAGS